MSRLSRLIPRIASLRRAAALLAVGAPVAFAAVAAPAAEAAPTAPPPVSILTSTGNIGQGDIFISPFGDTSTYANGPEILDSQGDVVWFQAVPAGEEASDFRTQTYDGQPVLTWWQGTGLGGQSSGTDYIYNDHYQQIATVNAGNGLSADGHEFLITPQNTALILSYHDDDGEPDVDRRPRRPDGDQRRRPGDRHRHRSGPVPVEQRRPRPLQPERAAAAGLGERRRGTGSTSTPSSSTPTATC